MTLEDLFPNLKSMGYMKVSCEDSSYNCIAWAFGVNDTWWEPTEGYYWPGKLYNCTVEALVKICEQFGYAKCENAEYEDGFEKVAIYGDKKNYTHMARQLGNGKWTSKLGGLEDIEHDLLDALVGTEYGEVKCIMRKKKDDKK